MVPGCGCLGWLVVITLEVLLLVTAHRLERLALISGFLPVPLLLLSRERLTLSTVRAAPVVALLEALT